MKITLDSIMEFRVTDATEVFDFIKNWEEKVKPHLQSREITEALKKGFEDHFSSKEELDEYPWEEPRLDIFGAMGFNELHEIIDEETFKDYIGEDYEEYFKEMENRWQDEDEEYRDWVKDHSYFAYRALSRCHHLAPFCVEIGKKIKPDYEWYHFETPGHSNAIGVENGEIKLIMDLLWGESTKDPQKLMRQMFDHSFLIIKNQFKHAFKEEELEIIKNSLNHIKEQVCGTLKTK